jgi:hypothetical protein
MVGGDENSSKDVGMVIYYCSKIQRELNTAVALVHHTTKTGGVERGSSALRGAADQMIQVDGQPGNPSVKVTCSKPKEHESWPDEKYRLLPVEASAVLLPADRCAAFVGLSKVEYALLDFMGQEIFDGPGVRWNVLRDGVEVKSGTLSRHLSRMKKLGYVANSTRGDPYHVTEVGRAILNGQLPLDTDITTYLDDLDYNE